GLQTAYLIDAVSFACALYGVLRLPAMPPHGGGAPLGVRTVLAGLRFVRRQPIIATALLVDLNATIFGMPFALFPALAATHFGGGPQTVGLLYAAPALGGLTAATCSGPLAHIRHQGRAVLLAIAGGADVVNGVFRTTILQVNTPDALQGG